LGCREMRSERSSTGAQNRILPIRTSVVASEGRVCVLSTFHSVMMARDTLCNRPGAPGEWRYHGPKRIVLPVRSRAKRVPAKSAQIGTLFHSSAESVRHARMRSATRAVSNAALYRVDNPVFASSRDDRESQAIHNPDDGRHC
jgi:hypothetical protein